MSELVVHGEGGDELDDEDVDEDREDDEDDDSQTAEVTLSLQELLKGAVVHP